MKLADAPSADVIRAVLQERYDRQQARRRARYHADHFVYRVFDANDVLLYVGCTADLHARMRAHRSTAAWFAEATRLRVRVVRGMGAALALESALIRTEHPVWNANPQESARRGWETRRRRHEAA